MKRIVVIAAALVITALGVQAPAAGTVPQGDQSVLDRLLSPADVPRALGAAPTDPFKSDRGTKSPSDVFGCWPDDAALSAPTGFTAMVDTSRPSGQLYREVDEVVSLFSSVSAAKRAWRLVVAGARGCDGRVVVSDAADPPDGSTITDRYTSGTSAGGNAVWVSESSRWSTSDPISNGAVTTVYTVYRKSGKAIVATWTYVNGKAQTNAAERRAVLDLSATLTARW